MVALFESLDVALGFVAFMVAFLLVGIPIKFAGSHRLGKTYGAVFYLGVPCYSPTTWDRSPKFSPASGARAVVLGWALRVSLQCVLVPGNKFRALAPAALLYGSLAFLRFLGDLRGGATHIFSADRSGVVSRARAALVGAFALQVLGPLLESLGKRLAAPFDFCTTAAHALQSGLRGVRHFGSLA